MFRIIKPPYLLKRYFYRLTWEIPDESKNLYLTFDDGPTPGVTEWVISLLKEYNAKATFFCIGENVKKNPALFDSLLNAGHRIGNHTQHHINGWDFSSDDYLKDTMEFDRLYQTDLFRPPYGKIKKSQVDKLKQKFKIIMWSVISFDFDSKTSKEKCLKNVISNADKGSIVVFHDSKKAFKNLQYTLPKVLEHFSSKGYKFSSL